MIARPKNSDKALNNDLGIAKSCCRKLGFIHARPEAVLVDRERRWALQGLGVSFCERLLFLTQIHDGRRVVDRNRPSNSGELLYMTRLNWGPIDSLMVCKPGNI
jgi:hypothetical protein